MDLQNKSSKLIFVINIQIFWSGNFVICNLAEETPSIILCMEKLKAYHIKSILTILQLVDKAVYKFLRLAKNKSRFKLKEFMTLLSQLTDYRNTRPKWPKHR